MKNLARILYIVYQYCIAIPLLILFTLFTSVTTIVFAHWRNAAFLHTIQQWWSRSFFYLLFLPVTVDGLENIEPGQSYVFVANHQSMFDVWVVYGWLPVVFKWLMKAELRHIPFVGAACRAAGHIFVERQNARASLASLNQIKNQLRDGVCTVIFPEGTRSQTGEMGRFKRGAFQIAWDLNLPVVPISLSGFYNVMPKGAWHAFWHPVHMHVGKPIQLSKFDDIADSIDYVHAAVAEGLR